MTSRSLTALARTHRPLRLLPIAVATAVAWCAPATAGPTSPCSLAVGQRVLLQSDPVDPDVFLWDSRDRLIAYVAGGWDSTRDVMVHTLLASPGTNALVISCVPGVAHPKYTGDAIDAIGVKIVRGNYRGHFGWIIATDARPVAAPSARASR